MLDNILAQPESHRAALALHRSSRIVPLQVKF
jgi:hypothetical protein